MSDESCGISLDYLIATPSILTGGDSYRGVLDKARRLLSSQDRWTQGSFARDRYGDAVKPKDPMACSWCLLGAVAATSNDLGISPPALLRYLEGAMNFKYGDQFSTIGEMNDYVDHASVMQFLDEAIARFGA